MVESFEISSLSRREVLHYLGYRGQGLTDELEGRIDDVMAACLKAGRPRGVWRVFDIVARETSAEGLPEVCLAGTALSLRGRSMERHMRGAHAAAVMAVTAGMGVERELRRLSLTNSTDEVVFDACGTVLVEAAADACEAKIDAWAAGHGYKANRRFSPGYGDMPLDTQPVLLATLDAERQLGITLSSTLLMTPTKSVTAVLGLFRTDERAAHGKEIPDATLAATPSCEECAASDACLIRASGRTCRDK